MKTPGGGYLDAEPVRRHLRKLRWSGASLPALMAATGLSRRGVVQLIKSPADGGNRFVTRAVAATVLAVRRVRCLDNQLIDAGPTKDIQRRLLKVMSGRRMERETGYRRVEERRLRVSVALAKAYREAAAFFLDCPRDSHRVALDPDVLRAAPVRPSDEALDRAYHRALAGGTTTIPVAARLCADIGLDFEEAIA